MRLRVESSTSGLIIKSFFVIKNNLHKFKKEICVWSTKADTSHCSVQLFFLIILIFIETLNVLLLYKQTAHKRVAKARKPNLCSS